MGWDLSWRTCWFNWRKLVGISMVICWVGDFWFSIGKSTIWGIFSFFLFCWAILNKSQDNYEREQSEILGKTVLVGILEWLIFWSMYLEVSTNGGTPKWMVYNSGHSYTNWWFWGTSILGNPHMAFFVWFFLTYVFSINSDLWFAAFMGLKWLGIAAHYFWSKI